LGAVSFSHYKVRKVGERLTEKKGDRYKEESQKLAKIAAYVDRHARIIVTEAITCEEDIIWKTNTTIDEVSCLKRCK